MRYCMICGEKNSHPQTPTCGRATCLAERRARLHAEGRTRGGPRGRPRAERRWDRNGSPILYAPGYPGARKNGFVLESTVMIEQKIGRRLERHEYVHHRNGNKRDNSHENIELRRYGDSASCLCHVESDSGGFCPAHPTVKRPLTEAAQDLAVELLERMRARQKAAPKKDADGWAKD